MKNIELLFSNLMAHYFIKKKLVLSMLKFKLGKSTSKRPNMTQKEPVVSPFSFPVAIVH